MKKLFFFLPLLLVVHLIQAQTWDWGGPLDPLQAKFQIQQYRLELEIFPETQSIAGLATITFSANEKLDTLRFQLIDQYRVHKVLMDGKEVAFSQKNDLLDILPIDCTCNQVQIFYEGPTPIAQNPPWTGGFTWEKDQMGRHWMGLSCQGEGAKVFMPALDHPSSEPQQGVDLLFTVPKPYFIASNGRLIQSQDQGQKVCYHWETNYPINNYNINFTLGVFEKAETQFQSISGAVVPMAVWVLQENKSKAKELLEVLRVSAQTHEKYFGAYPFPEDKIAVVETPYLGMEHQTINAYGNNFQFVPMGKVKYDWLLHHELGHEWFGNKVSVADWADMWIHEGLTAYGDWLFYWEHGGSEAYFEKVTAESRDIPHARTVVSPPNSTEKTAYHPEIYTKGAMVIHSLRGVLGDGLFFPAIKAFAESEQFTYLNLVTTQDFTDFIQRFTGQNLEGFFELYLKTTRLPEVKVKKKGKDQFLVALEGIEFELPVEVKTSTGIKKYPLGKTPTLISSTTTPEVDPRGWLMLQR
jgi:aminopeptidase N